MDRSGCGDGQWDWLWVFSPVSDSTAQSRDKVPFCYWIRAAESSWYHPSVNSAAGLPLYSASFNTVCVNTQIWDCENFRTNPFVTKLYFSDLWVSALFSYCYTIDIHDTWLVLKGNFTSITCSCVPICLSEICCGKICRVFSERLQSFQNITDFRIEMAAQWVTRWCVRRHLTNQITEIMLQSLGKHVAVVIALESDFWVTVIYTHNKLNLKVFPLFFFTGWAFCTVSFLLRLLQEPWSTLLQCILYVCALGLAYFFKSRIWIYLISGFNMLMWLIIDEGLIMHCHRLNKHQQQQFTTHLFSSPPPQKSHKWIPVHYPLHYLRVIILSTKKHLFFLDQKKYSLPNFYLTTKL